MFKALFLGFLLLLALPVGVLLLVILPVMLVGLVLKVLLAVLLLPFRVLGMAVAAVAGVAALLAKGFLLLIGLLVCVGLLAGGAAAFVLLPVAVVALLAWAAFKLLVAGSAVVV